MITDKSTKYNTGAVPISMTKVKHSFEQILLNPSEKHTEELKFTPLEDKADFSSKYTKLYVDMRG